MRASARRLVPVPVLMGGSTVACTTRPVRSKGTMRPYAPPDGPLSELPHILPVKHLAAGRSEAHSFGQLRNRTSLGRRTRPSLLSCSASCRTRPSLPTSMTLARGRSSSNTARCSYANENSGFTNIMTLQLRLHALFVIFFFMMIDLLTLFLPSPPVPLSAPGGVISSGRSSQQGAELLLAGFPTGGSSSVPVFFVCLGAATRAVWGVVIHTRTVVFG